MEKIFSKDITDKELISKIYTGLFKFSHKKIKNPIKNYAKHLNKHLIKEDIQMTKKHMKKCSHHISSGKCKLKQSYH